MIYKGRIEETNLEGGGKIFVSSTNEPFQLEGITGAPLLALPTNTFIEIDGDIQKDIVTLMMSGPVLKVNSWKQL